MTNFRNGVFSPEFYGRASPKIVDHIVRLSDFSVKELAGNAGLDSFVSSLKNDLSGLGVVGIFKKDDKAEMERKTLFLDFSLGHRDLASFRILHVESGDSFGSVRLPYIMSISSYDGFRDYVFKDDLWSEEHLESFVLTRRLPIIDEYDRDLYGNYFLSRIPTVFLFYFSPLQRTFFLNMVLEKFNGASLGTKYRHKAPFLLVDGDSFRGMIREFKLGSSDSQSPMLSVAIMKEKKYFPFASSELSRENVDLFLAEILTGVLSPFALSEPVFERSGTILQLTHDSFGEFVLKKPRSDILIYVFAPWCRDCEAFNHEYEKLAAHISSISPKTLLFSFNVEANDIPKSSNITRPKHLPSLVFYPSISDTGTTPTGRVPILYSGPMELSSILEFIQSNSGASSI